MRKLCKYLPLIVLILILLVCLISLAINDKFSSFVYLAFENIISSVTGALLFLCFLIFLGWLYLVKFYPLTALQWKKADFYWLGLTSISLISYVGENRIRFAERDIFHCDNQIYITTRDLKSNLKQQWICMQFQRTDYNKVGFDSLQKQYNDVCEWRNEISPIIDSSTFKEKCIPIDSIVFPHYIEDEQLNQYILDVKKGALSYNKYIAQKHELNKNTNKRELESILKILVPLTLILGLSIRFTKTIGEIRLQRRNNE